MKNPAFPSLCLAGILAVAGCATKPDNHPTTVEQLFKKADTSGDGRVSRTEYQDFMIEEIYLRYDKDGDGIVTEAEFVASGGTPEAFRKINRNGSGKITLAEAKASPAIRDRVSVTFDEADVNHNGSVTWTEYEVARAKRQAYVR